MKKAKNLFILCDGNNCEKCMYFNQVDLFCNRERIYKIFEEEEKCGNCTLCDFSKSNDKLTYCKVLEKYVNNDEDCTIDDQDLINAVINKISKGRGDKNDPERS